MFGKPGRPGKRRPHVAEACACVLVDHPGARPASSQLPHAHRAGTAGACGRFGQHVRGGQVEALCDSPGVGQLIWQAALARDVPVLVNVTLLIAGLTIATNLLADTARAVRQQEV